MMVYGIILILIYVVSVAYVLYSCRTQESRKEFYLKKSEETDANKVIYYIKYGIIAALDLSIIGYLIYAVVRI